MCGIIACIGYNVYKYILYGINRLQNRGNDSYGIGSVIDGKLVYNKKSNPFKKSIEEVLFNYLNEYINIHIGIAHCRWSTHGDNSDKNAHPHVDYYNQFMLVHNGTINNYLELKKMLSINGFIFNSETDTEVIVNLISFNYNRTNNVNHAINTTLSQLDGTFGCVLLCINDDKSLWCFRKHCPLVVGWTDDLKSIVVCSEVSGFDTSIKHYHRLEENRIYKFNENCIIDNIYKIENIQKSINISIEDSNDTPYPHKHWMIKEIYQQSKIINHMVHNRIRDNSIIFNELDNIQFEILNNLIIIGCGTSYYAGTSGRHFFQSLNIFNTVLCIDASEFEITDIPKTGSTLFLLLSQSGETLDLIRVQELLNDNKLSTISIVNVIGSTIDINSTATIGMYAGVEHAVASTKSYSCQIVLMKLMSLWLQQMFNVDIINQLTPLHNISYDIDNLIKNCYDRINNWSKILSRVNSVFILGRKTCYSIAKEASLKLKEVAYIHAEAYSASALKHGPYSLIEVGNPIIFIISKNDNNYNICNTISEVKARGALTWVVSDDDKLEVFDDKIDIPYNQSLYGILHIIPFQILSYLIAINKGHNPDYPRNLAKSVTVD